MIKDEHHFSRWASSSGGASLAYSRAADRLPADMERNGTYRGVLGRFYEFMDRNSDNRTAGWFLVWGDVPLPLIAILVFYVYFCKNLGPRIMERREPFQLKKTLMVYNALNVIVSVWLVIETMQCGWWRDYNYRCQPVDYSDNPKAVRMARAVWIYYMCKLMELLETVFFVLRKKNNQVSYLHLYHHLIMPMGSWFVLKFAAGGHTTLGMPINCFVHAVMYTYYLLAAMGPQYQKYLWWKKYLTKLQLIQFVIVCIHQCQVFVFECNFPKIMAVLMSLNALYLFFLFGVFYIRTYLNKAKTA